METAILPLEERLDRVVSGFASVEGKRATGDLADAIAYSPAQTQRLFQKRFGEPPGQFRRRLMLERAAEALAFGDSPIWKVALECGFASSEPFIRAFERAYHLTPSRLRKSASRDTWLATDRQGQHEALHYWRGTIVSSESKGGTGMNLTDRLIGHDLWLTGAMLDRAKTLSDEQLDAKLEQPVQMVCFEEPDKTLRELLDNLVFTKEVWLGAVYNRPAQWEERDKSSAGLLSRWSAVEPEFKALATQIQEDGRWDDSFVDALCTPPVTFSFGGVFAHILTHAAGRKAMALRELRRHGIDDLGFGEPIDWERSLTQA